MADGDDNPYFLDFLFNNIVDVHFGGADYLVFKGIGQETDTHMATWIDGLFFLDQMSDNFAMGYDAAADQITFAGTTGTIRVQSGGVIENVALKDTDLKGQLKTASGGTLKKSFIVGVENGNSNATLVAFVALNSDNFKKKSLRLEINSAPEQPVTYTMQLFTFKADVIKAGKKIGDFLPSKAISHSTVVLGGNLARFNLDIPSLKITAA